MSSKRLPTSMYSPRPKIGKRAYQASHWSFGWDKTENTSMKQNPSVMKYHNESSFILQDKSNPNVESKREEMRKTKTEQFNSKLPTYDPKNANKSHIVFGGQERGDFSKKSSGITSPRMHPGGRSQIIFG